jgi:mannose-6-phosphate isomerase-like protein (cupin superfamily)
MLPWKTSRLSENADDRSSSGASEIRHLLSRPGGDLTHVRVPARSTSGVAVIKDTSEFFYVVSGSGRLRCGDSRDEGYSLRPQTCVSIPAGVSYQYDNPSEVPLNIVLAAVPGGRRARRSSQIRTLSSEPNAVAPDGSEIRFLAKDAHGSYVHCRLGAGLATQPVHHLTVEELVRAERPGGALAERRWH